MTEVEIKKAMEASVKALHGKHERDYLELFETEGDEKALTLEELDRVIEMINNWLPRPFIDYHIQSKK